MRFTRFTSITSIKQKAKGFKVPWLYFKYNFDSKKSRDELSRVVSNSNLRLQNTIFVNLCKVNYHRGLNKTKEEFVMRDISAKLYNKVQKEIERVCDTLECSNPVPTFHLKEVVLEDGYIKMEDDCSDLHPEVAAIISMVKEANRYLEELCINKRLELYIMLHSSISMSELYICRVAGYSEFDAEFIIEGLLSIASDILSYAEIDSTLDVNSNTLIFSDDCKGSLPATTVCNLIRHCNNLASQYNKPLINVLFS